MAPNKRNGKKPGKNSQPPPKPKKKVTVPRNLLDRDAAAYARLLNDPCRAPLAHPLYPGGEGGILARFESEATHFDGALITAGVLVWCPGVFGPAGGLAYHQSAASSTASTLATLPTEQPGYAFLQANASAVRIVSACMQVYWPGTELNRQGFISFGQVSGALLSEGLAGAVTSADNVRPLLTNHSRIPESMIEIKFRPFSGDMVWTDPSINDSVSATNGGMALTAYNLPVATGYRIRFVATYEYTPKFNLGVAAQPMSKANSAHTVTDVINELDKNPDWAYGFGQKVAYATKIGSSIYQGMTDTGMMPRRRR